MKEVCWSSDVAGQFEEGNGLRQGCTMAPTLFNIYFNTIVESLF